MDEMCLANIINSQQHLLKPVVPFRRDIDRLCQLDFTVTNKYLTDDLLNDIQLFSCYINKLLTDNNARYGIGGYLEHRTVYRFSKVFDAEKAGDEPRRLHLGTDIWGKPQTPVMAPFDGVVHSFAFNNNPGDYGATIILTHQLEGVIFYTLYGHLSLSSIKGMEEGRRLEAGETFAEFGIPAENGGWPPHLHFQVILDIGSHKGDYPGVCKYSERERWKANSPNPDLLLQMNQHILIKA